jgi:hypothetical protein
MRARAVSIRNLPHQESLMSSDPLSRATARLRAALATLLVWLVALPALADEAEWGLNDITLLYPLPASHSEMGLLLAPDAAGGAGPLLPARYRAQLPALHHGEDMAATLRALRVVAVRIDPCFRYRGDCLAQIRMVWQPIQASGYGASNPGGLEAKDTAVHTFYTLDADTFGRFLAEYDALRKAPAGVDSRAPLQVHPRLAREGLDGTFARAFKALLLRYCGDKTLWRVTAMATLVGGDKWAFSGFDIVDGRAVPLTIPRTGGARVQTFSVSLISDADYTRGRIEPAIPGGEDDISLLVNDSRTLARRDAATLRRLGEAVARIENPAIHSPETIDCVSCHATQVAGTLLFTRIGWLNRDAEILRQAFRADAPLVNTAATQTMPRVFRALGYFEKVPVLSRRVINETAAVAERMNRPSGPARLATN